MVRFSGHDVNRNFGHDFGHDWRRRQIQFDHHSIGNDVAEFILGSLRVDEESARRQKSPIARVALRSNGDTFLCSADGYAREQRYCLQSS